MNYLRQNAERLVVKYMLTTKPELINQLNLKEWFNDKEGKLLAWAILRAYKQGVGMDHVTDYIDWDKTQLTHDDIEAYTKIDLVDAETMKQVILYFRFMGMFTEMYYYRDKFSKKEVTAMQAIAEIVKRGEVTQKVIDIVLKLYDKHVGNKFYNRELKQQSIVNTLRQNENKILNKYNGQI